MEKAIHAAMSPLFNELTDDMPVADQALLRSLWTELGEGGGPNGEVLDGIVGERVSRQAATTVGEWLNLFFEEQRRRPENAGKGWYAPMMLFMLGARVGQRLERGKPLAKPAPAPRTEAKMVCPDCGKDDCPGAKPFVIMDVDGTNGNQSTGVPALDALLGLS